MTATTAHERKRAAEAAAQAQQESDTEARAQAILTAAATKKQPTTPAKTPGAFAYKEGRSFINVTVNVDTVTINEHRIVTVGELVIIPRALLTRSQWESIAPTLAGEFNRQLKSDEQAQGSFNKTGETRLAGCTVGKELILLCWAIETIDATDPRMSIARGGWLQLHPVERWWLYNQCLCVNGTLADRGRGWRAAIREAMTATHNYN